MNLEKTLSLKELWTKIKKDNARFSEELLNIVDYVKKEDIEYSSDRERASLTKFVKTGKIDEYTLEHVLGFAGRYEPGRTKELINHYSLQ